MHFLKRLILAVGVVSHAFPAVPHANASDRQISPEEASQVLAQYVERHAEAISAVIADRLDKRVSIVSAEACLARQANFDGGVPGPGQHVHQRADGQTVLSGQGVVGTCHVATADCQSGCGYWKSITIGLLTGDQPQLPQADATVTAVGVLDYDE